MFFKLCKNELKSSYRSFLVLYAILLISALLFDGNSDGMFSIIMILTYSVVFLVLCIMYMVTLIRNYHISMFSRNAYLTHTLPVSSTQLLLSKTVCAAFWYVISSIAFIISIIIVTMRMLNFDWSALIDAFSLMTDNGAVVNALLSLMEMIFSAIEFVLLIFLVMNAVHTKYVRKFRFVVAIILYIIIYLIVDFVFNNLLTSLFDIPSLESFFVSLTLHVNASSMGLQVLLYSIVKSIILSILYFLGSRYILDYKMEIE